MAHTSYIVDGDKWPSATELTHLLPDSWKWAWYAREVKKHGYRGWQKCHATSTRAMRLGTHTHGLVEAILENTAYTAWLDEAKTIQEPERRMKLVRKWAQALVETTTRHSFKDIEKKVIDKERREHGTIDIISVDDVSNKRFPKDWKTSGSISDGFPIQLAIYNRCLEAEGCEMAGFGEIERVDKELKSAKAIASGEHHVQVKRFENLAQYYPVIDALHVIWDYCNKQGKWKPQDKVIDPTLANFLKATKRVK